MAFENKIALITGASRGIGRAIAIDLAKQGAIVLGTATTAEGADKISKEIAEQGGKGKGFVLNVTHSDSIEQVLAEIKASYGDPLILINNAGITRDNLMLRMKEEEWQTVIDVNLNSLYRVTKSCLKAMIKSRWGRIVNISSIVGVTGNAGQANYAAAKAGIIGFSKSLAQEIGSREITVNVVAPGFIDTDMTRALSEEQQRLLLDKIPLQRLGKPEDIAHAVRFLASDEAAYITGQVIHVDGGMYM